MVDGFKLLSDLRNNRMQDYFGHVASFANTQKKPGNLTKAFDQYRANVRDRSKDKAHSQLTLQERFEKLRSQQMIVKTQ